MSLRWSCLARASRVLARAFHVLALVLPCAGLTCPCAALVLRGSSCVYLALYVSLSPLLPGWLLVCDFRGYSVPFSVATLCGCPPLLHSVATLRDYPPSLSSVATGYPPWLPSVAALRGCPPWLPVAALRVCSPLLLPVSTPLLLRGDSWFLSLFGLVPVCLAAFTRLCCLVLP